MGEPGPEAPSENFSRALFFHFHKVIPNTLIPRLIDCPAPPPLSFTSQGLNTSLVPRTAAAEL
jgi:hypothetical protein